jgi:hypothetical protein
MIVPDLWITIIYRLKTDTSHVAVEVEVENQSDEEQPILVVWLAHIGLGEVYDLTAGGWVNQQLSSVGALIPASDEVSYGFAPLPYEPGAHGLACMAGSSILLESSTVR